MKCGHPDKWVLKLKWNGRIYTYCFACLIEKLKMDNLEVYGNPYIKLKKTIDTELLKELTPKKVKPKVEVKVKKPKKTKNDKK